MSEAWDQAGLITRCESLGGSNPPPATNQFNSMSNLFHEGYKEEQEKLEKWAYSHQCSLKHFGAIGGAITFSLTPNNLGVVVKAECACGEKCDATDYGSW